MIVFHMTLNIQILSLHLLLFMETNTLITMHFNWPTSYYFNSSIYITLNMTSMLLSGHCKYKEKKLICYCCHCPHCYWWCWPPPPPSLALGEYAKAKDFVPTQRWPMMWTMQHTDIHMIIQTQPQELCIFYHCCCCWHPTLIFVVIKVCHSAVVILLVADIILSFAYCFEQGTQLGLSFKP